ncbi:MAG: porin [Burkholderiales bacterium]|nr:porin [Burkholderiales bacterium]
MFAKKNVVAAAALALLAMGAQAQVTLYGTADVSLGRKQVITGFDVNGKAIKSSSTNVDSSDMSQSFVGIKGQEDLGGGLKAVFKLEAPIALDTGAATTNFFGQNATVGLAGDFGAVNLGRFESLYKLEGGAFNPFGTSKTFSPTFNTGLASNDSWSNGISYVSPNLSGLTLSAQVSLAETAKSTATTYSGGAYAVSANYVAGPLGLSAVFGEVKSTDATVPADKSRPWLLGASYDFGVVKLFGQYGQTKLNEKSPAASAKHKGFQVGVGVPVTANGAVLASYGENKETIENVSGSSKGRDFSLGYTHNLSKRTNVYAAVINERVSDLTVAPAAKGTINSFAVGVRHSF